MRRRNFFGSRQHSLIRGEEKEGQVFLSLQPTKFPKEENGRSDECGQYR